MNCQPPKIKTTKDFKTGNTHISLPAGATTMNRKIHSNFIFSMGERFQPAPGHRL